MVLLLVVASLIGFATGALKPTLGLDLEGGVSVILNAPEDTPDATSWNRRSRTSGTASTRSAWASPTSCCRADTIEVQIPGLTNGIGRGASEGAVLPDRRRRRELRLRRRPGRSAGGARRPAGDQPGLGSLRRGRGWHPARVLHQRTGGRPPSSRPSPCRPRRPRVPRPRPAVRQRRRRARRPNPTRVGSASPTPRAQQYGCFHHQEGGAEGGRRPDGRGHGTQLLRHRRRHRHRRGGLAHPVGHARPFDVRRHPSPSASASPSASPSASGVSGLDLQGTETLPCELETKADAQDALDAIAVSKQTVQYCVISSAAENLGCFIDRDAAEQERRATPASSVC